MDKQKIAELVVKFLGRNFKREFQYPKAQRGVYDVPVNRLEKVKWAYRHWYNQLEVAEKGLGIEDYFRNQDLSFDLPEGFESEKTITLTSAGDLLAVDVLTPENTRDIFTEIKDFYSKADLVCANLESPVDRSRPIGRTQDFGNPAQMNTSREMLEHFVKDGGINFFSTANNHSNDWGEEGVLATIEELKRAGVYFSGTNASRVEQENPEILDIKGIKLAMLSYTMDLNGRKLDEGKDYLVNEVRFNDEHCDLALVKKQIESVRARGADFIVVCAHWGWEFEMYPHKNVIDQGHRMLELGVDLILGNHPHVAQPMEKYEYEKEGEKKQGFISYAAGNFVSYHPRSRNSSLAYILKFSISKGRQGGVEKTLMHDLRVLPIYLLNRELEDGSFDCRILRFSDVLEDSKGKKNQKYQLTDRELRDLEHLETVVLGSIIMPENAGNFEI